MPDNTIDVTLRFLTDQRSQQAAKQAILDMGRTPNTLSFGGLGSAGAVVSQTMKDFGISADQAAASLVGMAQAEGLTKDQLLAAYNQMVAFEQAASQSAAAVQAIDQNVQKMSRNVAGIRRGGRTAIMGIAGFTLAMTGSQLQSYGEALTKPVQEYIKYAGNADAASQRWLNTTSAIEQANLRIGRALADQTLPQQRIAVALAEQYASALENSAFLRGVVGTTSAVMQVAGGAMQPVGQTLSAVSTFTMLKTLAASSGTASAALTALATSAEAAAAANVHEAGASEAAATADTVEAGASGRATAGAVAAGASAAGAAGAGAGSIAVLPVLGEIIAGAIIASGVVAAIGKSNREQTVQNVQSGKQQGPIFLPGGMRADEANAKLQGLITSVNELGNSAAQATDKIDANLPEAAVTAFIQFQQSNADAEQQYEDDRTQILKDAGEARVELERSYEAERSSILQDLADNLSSQRQDLLDSQISRRREAHRQEMRYEEDYYASRSEVVKASGREAERAEEDHQRRMLQMRREHNATVEDLLDRQDAFGLLKENQRYEASRRDAEETYRVEVARRDEDLAERLAQMEREFSLARARREEDTQIREAQERADLEKRRTREKAEADARLKRLDAQHEAELDKIDAQAKTKIKELDQQFNKEMDLRRKKFNEQLLPLIGTQLGAIYGQYQTWLRTMYDQTAAYVDSLKKLPLSSSTTVGAPKVAGSRALGGPVYEGLWYLHDNERVLNKQETQLYQAMLSGQAHSSGNRSVTVHNHLHMDGGLIDSKTLTMLDRRMERATYRAIAEVGRGL